MTFSAVIPTWNEAPWLGRLLSSLDDWPELAEVVVADNNSTDQTIDIAKRHGCRIVLGGTPAVGRNRGARASTGEVILFMDADAVVPRATLQRIAGQFRTGPIACLHCRVIAIGGDGFVRMCYWAMDTYVRLLARFRVSQGVGTLIAVRRDAFGAVGGFRDDILVGEDADFLRRIGRIGPVKYERSAIVYTSPRRFVLEGRWLFAMKTVLWAVLRLIGISSSLIPYRWEVYPALQAKAETEAYTRTVRGQR